MNVQSLKNHQKVLIERHRVLDKQVKESYNRYISDEELKAQKLEKLRLKHEIENIQTQLETLNQERYND